MKPMKSVLTGLAAAGLLFSQAAFAAPQRTGSQVGASEQVAGLPRAAIPALVGLLAVLVAVVISANNDNDNDHNLPVSP